MAALWMTGTIFSFCLMAIVIRWLGDDIHVLQMLFVRSLIGLSVISLIIFSLQPANFKSVRIRLQVFRNVFHFLGQYGWYLGITLLPLSQVFAIEFTVPLWTLFVAAVALKESITRTKMVSIGLGFTGVLIIVQPDFSQVDWALFIVLGAAIAYAIAHTSTKALSEHDSVLTILFYMCLIQLPMSALLMIPHWKWPSTMEWMGLFAIGTTALTAHFCMIKAMSYGEITQIVILDFLRLPVIAIVAAWLFSETMEWTLLIGGLLMLLGNWILVSRARKIPS